jgi:hypothetical protein
MSLWSSVGECQKATFSVVKKWQRGDRQKAFWCVSNKGPRTDQLPSNYKREEMDLLNSLSLSLRGTMWLQAEQKYSLVSIQKFELTIPSRFQLFCHRLFLKWQASHYLFHGNTKMWAGIAQSVYFFMFSIPLSWWTYNGQNFFRQTQLLFYFKNTLISGGSLYISPLRRHVSALQMAIIRSAHELVKNYINPGYAMGSHWVYILYSIKMLKTAVIS